MSKSLKYLTVEAVKAIHSEVLAAHGGAAGIRDETLLESAVAAPQASMMGQPLISDPLEIAAAYLFYISGNHPFLDGNKRTALAACLVFLEENGLLPNRKLPINEWEQFVIDVASSKITRDETTRRLRKLLHRTRRDRDSRGWTAMQLGSWRKHGDVRVIKSRASMSAQL